MDIAVLSDIHGNYIALQRCVEYALERGIRRFVFLGDYLGELGYPRRTLHILYDMNARYECYFVRGNKEEYWLDYRNSGGCGWKDNDSTTGALLYSYSHLQNQDLDFFEKMPISKMITLDDMPQLTVCHGSPERVNEKMLPEKKRTYELMESDDSDIILCGHTHVQGKIEHNGKFVLNAGAVGTPLQSGGKAQFLILRGEDGSWSEEFVSLTYDVERVIGELHEEKLNIHAPSWCAVTEYMLRKGDISHGEVLTRAMELCENKTGKCVWPDVPEVYWKQAVQEMIKN